ncbi:MAG: DUF3857 domain-containing protein [Flavisolibacter sp.]
MKNIFLSILLVSCACSSRAGVKYPVSDIPAGLMKNANVVKRVDELEFRIYGTNETVERHHYVLTILNENGDGQAMMREYYDQLRQVHSIEGTLYDAAGNALKKLKSKDLQDLSATDNNLVDDDRVKEHRFYCKDYPYTVEYEVEIKWNNTLFFPAWLPQDAEYTAVEQSTCTIICPEKYEVRYRQFNYKDQPMITVNDGKKYMTWEVKNLSGIKRPYASPEWRELTTMIYFAPTDFEIQGYKGNMSSWKEFGKFQYVLNQNRDQLPDAILQTVHNLTTGITDDKEKVRVLYNYLQKNTRYVSIQLGIGGWQPFEASFVAQKGYGDCKALSNYMYSLLKAAGIKANYALVYAGQNAQSRILEDFPCEQFNHVILCVPFQKDTMWLECTSHDLVAGYMSGFTANRKALVINEDGGTLVSTPRYTIRENLQYRQIKAKVNEEGQLDMKVSTRYSAMQQDELQMMINALSREKVQKILQQELELSTYDVSNFQYAEDRKLLPELNEELEISVSGYATITGKRLFLTPNILNRTSRKFDADEKRTADFLFGFAFRDEDDYEIELPQGYQLEASSQDVHIQTKFGSYTCSVKLEGNKVRYHRVREQFAGKYPATGASDLAKFFEDIYKADRARIVLVKES